MYSKRSYWYLRAMCLSELVGRKYIRIRGPKKIEPQNIEQGITNVEGFGKT